jgi:hypothetical protein
MRAGARPGVDPAAATAVRQILGCFTQRYVKDIGFDEIEMVSVGQTNPGGYISHPCVTVEFARRVSNQICAPARCRR